MKLDFNTFLNLIGSFDFINDFSVSRDEENIFVKLNFDNILDNSKDCRLVIDDELDEDTHPELKDISRECIEKLGLITEIIKGFNITICYNLDKDGESGYSIPVPRFDYARIDLKYNLDMLKDFELVKKD